MKMKLVIMVIMMGVSAINSASVDTPGNQLNILRNPRLNLLPGVNVQESEANILTPRISNNVKDDSNADNLGGYRPLFPPYFPLNNPFPSKKMYFDKEYYTRGTDELNFPNNANEDRDNFARSRPLENQQTVPVQRSFSSFGTNNVRTFQQGATSSFITNFQTFDSSTRNTGLQPVVNSWLSDAKIKDDHEVTFIMYQ